MTELSYLDLIGRLTDLTRLATPPPRDERTGTFSSYDRRSRYNASTDQYEAWDANDDGTGVIRHEDDYVVVFEATGPGVIWRVWAAFADMGHIQIFIDDAATPVVDMPFRDFFERHPANLNPLGITNLPQLTPTLSRGRNRFLPIPYQRSCKIRMAPGWGLYYHFTYTSFGADTQVPSYTGTLTSTEWMALAQADRDLAQRGYRLPTTPHSQTEYTTVTVAAGTSATLSELTGTRAIHGMQMSIAELTDANATALLADLRLAIYWDDETTPSVDVPLGHFFGSAPGLNYYRTLPMGMTTGFLYSHWYMPFVKKAHVAVVNRGTQVCTVRLGLTHAAHAGAGSDMMHFHAQWHGDNDNQRQIAEGRAIDWPIIALTGRGRFCGVHLHINNRWQTPAQPAPSWGYGAWDQKNIDWGWGEGDEKFFVDGEKFPSTFGTGSEDYVGYAWAAEPPFPVFDSAYAAQSCVPIDGNGETSVVRVHICDDVPFQHRFEACIEKYKPNVWGDDNVCVYDVVVYWYQV